MLLKSTIKLFNNNHTVKDSAIDHISKQVVIAELDVLPLLGETMKAIGQLDSNKVISVDGIAPEAWINGGLELHTKFHELLISCWEHSVVPQDISKAVIITPVQEQGGQIWLLQLSWNNPAVNCLQYPC